MENLGRGVYSLSEAASYAQLPHQTLHSWFRPAASRAAGPVFESDYPGAGELAISFHDLVDVLVAGHLRSRSVPLQRIRKWYRALQERWAIAHPFCHERLRLDSGKRELFLELDAVEGLSEFAEVLSGQQYFANVIEPFLSRIEYEKHLARAWHIHKGVVLDPAVSFGKPTIEGRGTTTRVIHAEFLANDRDASIVADLYHIPRESVLDAVAFEESYRKAAA